MCGYKNEEAKSREKGGGQVWVLNPAETFSKEVDSLFKNFIGEGVSMNKRPPDQPIQICHTILDGIGRKRS